MRPIRNPPNLTMPFRIVVDVIYMTLIVTLVAAWRVPQSVAAKCLALLSANGN